MSEVTSPFIFRLEIHINFRDLPDKADKQLPEVGMSVLRRDVGKRGQVHQVHVL